MRDTCLLAIFTCVARAEGTFCCAEGGWDGDVVEELALLALVQAVGDGFRGVDGAAATDGDDSVDVFIFEDLLGCFVELFDGSMLADLGEGASVVFGAEELFDGLDEVGFGG